MLPVCARLAPAAVSGLVTRRFSFAVGSASRTRVGRTFAASSASIRPLGRFLASSSLSLASTQSQRMMSSFTGSSTTTGVTDPISPDNTFLFLCDIQETFRGKIVQYDTVIAAAAFLSQVGGILRIPVVTTEQAPFKPTVAELTSLISSDANPDNVKFTKSTFSMLTPDVLKVLDASPSRRHIVLFGIEAHVCVLQTALDLLRRGFHVHLVVDGVSSQGVVDRDTALERMKAEAMRVAAAGAVGNGAALVLTTAESVVYEMMRDAQHPKFKALVPAIKQYAQAKKQPAATGAEPAAKSSGSSSPSSKL